MTRRAWLASAIAAGAIGCRGRRRPHLLLIVADALRARNLGCYGYGRPTSPAIDRLAREGALFRQAISVGGNTTTALPALFTGQYPFFEYGAPWTDAPFGLDRFQADPPRLGLPDSLTTLAEHLSSAGYRTAAVVTNPYVTSTFAMHRGFQVHHEVFAGDRWAPAERVVGATRRHLGGVDWTQPTFLYLHFMDAHGPYREPDPAVVGRLDGGWAEVSHLAAWEAWEQLSAADPARHAREREYMTAAYDSAVRHVDGGVGEVVGEYERRGVLDETVVAVMSDHGEEFLEHGGTTHKGTLFEELVHVPLVLRGPGVDPGVRPRDLVRSLDVTATLLDYAGVPSPTTSMEGRSLRDLLEGRPFEGPTHVYAGFPEVRMLRTARYKLLRDQRGAEQLFDLVRDPAELTNLAASGDPAAATARVALAAQLDRTVERLRRQGPGRALGSPATLDDAETRERLRALGYLP